jgi:leucyl-tRNA synthetase
MGLKKSGVVLGAHAINRLNGEEIPIWVADYVLPSYGTGAVMGVPAHDQRDFEFATEFGLPIKVVIAPEGWNGEELEQAYEEPGIMVNSGQFSGLPSEEGKDAIANFIEEKGYGRRAISYRLRDWLISRQRYWGAPIPIVYCPRCGTIPVPEEALPVLLPEDAEFKPSGESPLKYCPSFVNTTCPRCGGAAQRETDTMDTFMCSSWYFLRYASPDYQNGPFDPQKVRYWFPIDLYTGGAEHATMHLLYARFFIKALKDLGLVDFAEPFVRLFNQGVIVQERQKMSKSRGNVIDPDEYVAKLGADAVRAYLMFIAPWEQGGEWNDSGLIGVSRWLNRVWNLVMEEPKAKARMNQATERELRRLTHKTIKKVTEDLEGFHFNTMVAALMEFTNHLTRVRETYALNSPAWQEATEALLLLLAPTAPHLAEELWTRSGHPYSIHNQPFPTWDDRLAAEEEFTLVIQVNGKLRDKVTVPVSITEEEARSLALSRERVQRYLPKKTQIRQPPPEMLAFLTLEQMIDMERVEKIIYVPGRLVNVVLR